MTILILLYMYLSVQLRNLVLSSSQFSFQLRNPIICMMKLISYFQNMGLLIVDCQIILSKVFISLLNLSSKHDDLFVGSIAKGIKFGASQLASVELIR